MIEFIQNFHFLRPWILLFLLLPVCFYLKKIGIRNYLSSWENICDKNLLKYLLVSSGSQKRISLKKYIYLGMFATIIAAAGPSWKKVEVPTFVVENPTMFLLSLAKDMQLTDITPSRLERSKYTISDIAEMVPAGQFGLEVYSKEPYVITPLSDDVKVIKNLLPQITPDIVPDQGDRLDRAIDLAVTRFKAAGYSNGNIVIFASDVGQRLDLALNKVQEATKMNYNIHIIDTSFYGNDKLQMMAEKGNGVYMSIKNPQLQKLISKLRVEDDEKARLSENLRSNYLDYGYYLVFISLLCLLPFFRRGLLIFILLMSFTTQAQAGFLLNDNQEGLRLFNIEQYDLALKKFKDNFWKSITLYKMDKKEEALKELSDIKTDAAYYNSGVILTKLCKYKEALSAFEEALKLNPDNKDAEYNKNVLTDLFEKAKDDPSVLSCDDEQQQQQNQQQNQNNNSDEQQEQDNQSSEQQNQQDNQDNNEQQENSSDEQQDQQEQNENQNNQQQDSSSDEQQNEQKQDNQEQNEQNDEAQSDNSSNKNDSNENKPDDNAPKNDNQQQNAEPEKQNTPSEANNDSGDEQKSDNKEGDDNNANEQQEEEIETQVMNAKKGDENTQYDEEALAMQRRYREIPEDPGGLLREFIKKEYMKDRYHDENM